MSLFFSGYRQHSEHKVAIPEKEGDYADYRFWTRKAQSSSSVCGPSASVSRSSESWLLIPKRRACETKESCPSRRVCPPAAVVRRALVVTPQDASLASEFDPNPDSWPVQDTSQIDRSRSGAAVPCPRPDKPRTWRANGVHCQAFSSLFAPFDHDSSSEGLIVLTSRSARSVLCPPALQR